MHNIAAKKAKERQESNSSDSFLKLMKEPSAYKPFLIINIFNTLQILSGSYIVIFYAIEIINEAAGPSFNSLEAATYSAVIRLVFSLIGCFLLLRITRRTMCMFSGIGSSLSCLILSVYLMLRSGQEKNDTDYWVTLICLLTYIGTNTVGFMILPSLMMGELLPSKIRGMLGGLTFMFYNIIMFGFAKVYPLIKTHLEIQGLFMIFGIASLLATIYMFLFYPETKDRSLNQIEEYFKQPNLLWITRKKT
jgi:hypothetical protein